MLLLLLLSHFIFLFFSLSSFFHVASFPFNDEGTADENAGGGDPCHGSCDPVLFLVVECIERYGDRLDGQQFSVMPLAGAIHEFGNICTGRMRDPSVGEWVKQ